MALKFAELPKHDDMVKNILVSYAKSNGDEREEGMNWYDIALEECRRLADDSNGWFMTEQMIGLMSVVSPGLKWDDNHSMPERIIDLWMRGIPSEDWKGFATYPANLKKCERILDGDFDAVRGRKVVSFFMNINGDANVVTVDRWAIRIALNDATLGNDKIVPSSKKTYEAIANAYIEAAELIGIEPRQMQAVTWVYYRGKFAGKTKARKVVVA